jgi:ubiquinone/menaquinone biosynthesis C-methylase UbiE
MSPLVKAARARLIGDRPNDWQVYHRMIKERLRPGMRVLEVGCGVGNIAPFPWHEHPEIELIGMDPNPEAQRNRNLRRFELLTDLGHWPIDDGSIDLVLARYVLEHVERPEEFFGNLARVLRPNGLFIALTPNYLQPAMIVSGMLPLRVKQWVLKKAGFAEADDVFATWYRANTVPRLSRYAEQFGMRRRYLQAHQFIPAGYLNFNIVGFFLEYSYHQTIHWVGLEPWLGGSILAVLQKANRSEDGQVAQAASPSIAGS